MKGVLKPNMWVSQQHNYLKHGGCEPVANKKMTLGQVVPNFGGGPTLHPPTLHEDNSTQKFDTERPYTREALHQKQ